MGHLRFALLACLQNLNQLVIELGLLLNILGPVDHKIFLQIVLGSVDHQALVFNQFQINLLPDQRV